LFINKKDVYEIHIFSCKELFFSVHSLRYGLKKTIPYKEKDVFIYVFLIGEQVYYSGGSFLFEKQTQSGKKHALRFFVATIRLEEIGFKSSQTTSLNTSFNISK